MRSTVFVFLSISTLFINIAQAQSNELIIQGQTGKLFLSHMVEAKETWYSIGRLFNIGPKALAAYNNLDMDKPLIIGQQVEIPLTTANFSQTTQKIAGEALVPVYHLVAEKEWMYRISINHNKVPIGSLEKWNHITKDQVRAGMYLVVGFLKVKTALSAYAKQPPPTPVSQESSANSAATATPMATLTAPPTAGSSPTTNSGKTSPGPVNERSDTTPMTMNKPPAGKKATTPVGQISSFSETTKTGDKTGGKEDKKTNATPPKEETAASPVKTTPINFNGGYFRSDFSEGSKTANGTAGTFKSTSGWQDGKYYALMNNVAVGTIVKLTLPSTGRSVYVKVLGSLPDMKESAGLLIRISNAAASELSIEESKFGVEINY
jgi:hypothetical protein